MLGTRAFSSAVLAPFLALSAGLSLCDRPPRGDIDGWKPAWIDDPPEPGRNLGVQPLDDAPVDDVSLRWKLDSEGFAYSMSNRVSVKVQGGGAGSVDTETRGEIEITPLDSKRARFVMSSSMGSGLGVPFTRSYVLDDTGRLDPADPRSQSIIDLIFPLVPEKVKPGEKRVVEIVIPDTDGNARTRGTTTLGVIGFARVSGRICAIVALEHEASIFLTGSGREVDTGSRSRVELLGYFDLDAGRYLSVAIRERSLTRRAGQPDRTTDRHASYVLVEGE